MANKQTFLLATAVKWENTLFIDIYTLVIKSGKSIYLLSRRIKSSDEPSQKLHRESRFTKNEDVLDNIDCAGEPVHQHPPLPHRVLPAAGRDHPAHLPRCAFTRKTCTFYNDSRHF